MTPLEQIDFVFFYLKDKIQAGGSWGYYNISNYIDKCPETKINKVMLTEIVQKLKDDGYITEKQMPEAQPVYHVTFKGLIFEGYTKEYETSMKETVWLKNIQIQTLTTSRKLNILTWIIAIGTGIAAIYYILEIFSHWFCIHTKN